MIALAWLLLVQAPVKPPVITMALDRRRLGVGEECLLTVQVTSSDPRSVSITLPPIQGFTLRSRIERSEPAADGTDAVTTHVELTLRAIEPGHWRIGPARAMVGTTVIAAPPVVVDVGAAPDLLASTPNPRLRALLQRVAPPRKAGDVSLQLLTTGDTARVGEQVDVLAAAWFPRELRLQLRRPPVLQPPVVGGVWALAQAAPGGLATSKLIGGEWYDLFISHQTIFPLAAGTVVIPAATLRYSVPVALQFLSQEESYELNDGPRRLTVLPLPQAGRPGTFTGAVGHGITLERHVGTASAQVGDAVPVDVVVRGEGNVSLWPIPTLAWPADVRAYPDNTEDHPGLVNGRVGGDKRFRYIVVPGRAGAVALPEIRYGYFDPVTGQYAEATLAAASLPVRAGPAQGRAAPLPLLAARGSALTRRIADAAPAAVWLGVLGLMPLGALAMRRRRAPPRVPTVANEDPVPRLERLILAVAGGDRDIPLPVRLRAAGVDAETAARLLTLLDALTAARYGPHADGVRPSLAVEAAALASRLEPIAQRRRQRHTRAVGALLLLVGLSGHVLHGSDGPTPASLYHAGTYGEAAEAFSRQASAARTDPALWYDAAAARAAAGADDVGAAAALVRARRLAPRDPQLRAAASGAFNAAIDDSTRWVALVTPDELLLLGAVGWLLGWGFVSLRVRWRRAAPVVGLASVLLGAGGALGWWYQRPVALVRLATPLRGEPHGRGEVVTDLTPGTVVSVGAARNGWRLATTDEARSGWVPATSLAPLAP